MDCLSMHWMMSSLKAAGDYLINPEVLLPVGNSHELVRALHWKCNHEGAPVGTAHCQSALDSHIYKVQFLDGKPKSWL
jgi:hypothetical protein